MVPASLGAAAAAALTAYAGRHNPSVGLVLLFVGWVTLPFAALAVANGRAGTAAPRARTVWRAVTNLIGLASVAVYATIAFGPPRPRMAFYFLITPAAAWLVIATAAACLRLARPRR